jgi:hypothetical protein
VEEDYPTVTEEAPYPDSPDEYEDEYTEYPDDWSDTPAYEDDLFETSEPRTGGTGTQEEALDAALEYLQAGPASRTRLIEWLENEGFSTENATYGADSCGADWMDQARQTAEVYKSISTYSGPKMASQLEFDGFTPDEAAYGADAAGLNDEAASRENALSTAKAYVEHSYFSKQKMIEQLSGFDGYSQDDAIYAADNCGADWMKSAVETARTDLEYSEFTWDEMVEELQNEGFTQEEAEYAADEVGL